MSELVAAMAVEGARRFQATLDASGQGAGASLTWPQLSKTLDAVIAGRDSKKVAASGRDLELGLGAWIGERLVKAHQGFWFLHRDLPERMAVGFPGDFLMVSPFEWAAEALRVGNSAPLREREEALANALKAHGASKDAASRLSADEYERMFDPGNVMFVAIDAARARQTWNASPRELGASLRAALAKSGRAISEDGQAQLDRWLVQPLERTKRSKLAELASSEPRLFEQVTWLFAGVGTTAAATEEFWSDLIFPFLRASAAPEPERVIASALEGSNEPFLAYLRARTPGGKPPVGLMLGHFAPADISPAEPRLADSGTPRLFKVKRAGLLEALQRFDPAAELQAFRRFVDKLAQVRGLEDGRSQLSIDLVSAAASMLKQLEKLLAQTPNADLCVYRVTEGEAKAAPAFAVLRSLLEPGADVVVTQGTL